LNVHVNRAPISGVVKRVFKVKGGFKPAFTASSEGNCRNYVFIEGEIPVVVVQIAGFLARRILCWVGEGDRVNIGDRIGRICFGSRVDVYLPAKVKVVVSRGNRVLAGETIIARISL